MNQFYSKDTIQVLQNELNSMVPNSVVNIRTSNLGSTQLQAKS
jgi:hypothetical protein